MPGRKPSRRMIARAVETGHRLSEDSDLLVFLPRPLQRLGESLDGVPNYVDLQCLLSASPDYLFDRHSDHDRR